MTALMKSVAALATISLTATLSTIGYPSAASAASPNACQALNQPVHQRLNPSNAASFLATSRGEAANMVRSGFTADGGIAFKASVRGSKGLRPVHRLYREASKDYLFTASTAEARSARSRHGYVDQGVSFHVSGGPADCLTPVHRYLYRGKHRLVTTGADRKQLAEAGATYEGVSFYAAPAQGTPSPGPDKAAQFTLAVIPDTQQEVVNKRDRRWLSRTRWLVENKSALNLRFVTDTGDVTNWGSADRSQFAMVRAAMKPLEAAGVPYSLALGNHDTAAVCHGGGACNPAKTRSLFRNTHAFNDHFSARGAGAVAGQFERDRLDNSYSTFSAGGLQWLVLTMEMWPRKAAVSWAEKVVAQHPRHNVVVVTHQYLTPDGRIATSFGYGDSSPRYLYERLISRYANVKLVLAGHVGRNAYRTDTGVKGNKIPTILLHLHDTRTNPLRLIRIDTRADTMSSTVYAPFTNEEFPRMGTSTTRMNWIR